MSNTSEIVIIECNLQIHKDSWAELKIFSRRILNSGKPSIQLFYDFYQVYLEWHLLVDPGKKVCIID